MPPKQNQPLPLIERKNHKKSIRPKNFFASPILLKKGKVHKSGKPATIIQLIDITSQTIKYIRQKLKFFPKIRNHGLQTCKFKKILYIQRLRALCLAI